MTRGERAGDRAPVRRLPSVLAQDALMSRTAGVLFLVGAGVNIAVYLGQSSRSSVGTIALAAVSAGTGVWLLVPRRHVSQRLLHLLLVFATALIAAEALTARDPVAALLVMTLTVFVSVAAFFFGWPHLVVHSTLAVICMTTVSAVHPGLAWPVGPAVAGFVVALTIINKLFLDMAVAAEFDPLTGLPNRQGFDRHLASWIARSESAGAAVLALADIDGPLIGSADATLLAVLDAWGPVLDAEDRLGRRDDAQIAILLPRTTAKSAVALVERLRAAAPVACAIGLTAWRDGESADLLLARAEAAMLQARLAGDGSTVIDVEDIASGARRLRRALAESEVDIAYQPIVGLSPGHPMVAIEALLRWVAPGRPTVSPQEIVQIAEQSGFAADLDDYVLRTACRDALTLQRTCGDGKLMLNVNVSSMNLVDRNLVSRIKSALTDTGWPAEQLTCEVTEEMLDLSSGAAMGTLRELRAGGVRIAVDDFGTGYSSLSRLQALPVDRLKLDKSITDAVSPECARPPALLRAVAAMAAALDLPVTVEGVETRRQLDVLAEVGFDQAQGFLFGAARGVEAFVEAAATAEHWWDPDRHRDDG